MKSEQRARKLLAEALGCHVNDLRLVFPVPVDTVLRAIEKALSTLTPPPPMGDALADCLSHREAWRTALVLALGLAEIRPPDFDDKAYWKHEIEAFDRTFATLSQPKEGNQS